jgi:NAD(P)-dependent dehydrogenase (short-subunit alcohol dehydrogenase family)
MIALGYGRIINIASIAGKDGNPNASAYSAAKAGLIGLTKILGKELATSGVLVCCVTQPILQQMTQEHVQAARMRTFRQFAFVPAPEVAHPNLNPASIMPRV